MQVEVTINPDGSSHKHYIADAGEHLVLTGPGTFGIKTLEDGTAVNLNEIVVAVGSEEQAAEVADLVGHLYAENGHPDDVDVLVDPDSGNSVPVQRPFNYEAPDGSVVEGQIGTAHGEHPFELVDATTTSKGN